MKRVGLCDRLTVSGQLDADDFAELAAAGVRRVINLRPDKEKPGQLTAADGAKIAGDHGMEYRHIPVTMQTLSADDVRAFGEAASMSDGGSVHAHCGSGQRVATLWALYKMMNGTLDRDEARRKVAEAGFHPAPGLAWLDAQAGA